MPTSAVPSPLYSPVNGSDEIGATGLLNPSASPLDEDYADTDQTEGNPQPLPTVFHATADKAWRAGLAAWQAGEYATAAAHFEGVASHGRSSPWLMSAGAFWTARAHLFARNPADVASWLAVAADYHETFYGLLARRILDLPMSFRWTMTADDEAALQAVSATGEGAAALAFIDARQPTRAEPLLRSLIASGQTQLAHGAMILAERAGLADLAFGTQRLLSRQGIHYHPAAYPIPHWRPEGGFRTDRALIFALMRQESNFRPGAVSRAGARGVMQLMPATARFVARNAGLSGTSVRDLRRPELNIELGQRYLEMLLEEGSVDGDLFRLAAAWNGGPGNLERWQRSVADNADPLLFIETIPAGETRAFIEHVLANLWIYRHRLGQPSPSLDALAAGQWPGYDGLERTPVEIAEHGQE